MISKDMISMIEKQRLHILKLKDLSKANINRIFNEFPEDVIYCEDDDNKFIGIITLGSWSRNKSEDSETWINKSCKRIMEQENKVGQIDEAYNIFKQFNKVKKLPIINKQNELVMEYSCEVLEPNNKLQSLWDEIQLFSLYPIENYFIANKFHRVLIVGESQISQTIYDLIKSIVTVDFILENNFTFSSDIMEQYDFIVFDSKRAKLYRKISNNKTSELSKLLEDILKIQAYCEIASKLNEKGIASFYVRIPNSIVNADELRLTGEEKDQITNGLTIAEVENNLEKYEDFAKKIYREYYNPEYLKEMVKVPPVISRGEYYTHSDYLSKYINVISGQRKTLGQPVEYFNKIHIFGNCSAFGYAVEDSHTIASFLQNQINQEYGDDFINVSNYGVQGIDSSIIMNMLFAIYKKGDLMIYISGDTNRVANTIRYNGFADCDLTEVFINREPNCFFNIVGHCNHILNKKIAETINNQIIKNYILDNRSKMKCNSYFEKENIIIKNKDYSFFEQNEELKIYLNNLKRESANNHAGQLVGAIVMNCNPFTLGHKYLIEKSAAKVDHLYIFVVEEDKSFFPFRDRIQLVREGVAEIKNVSVVSSGQFIISATTFPGYFVKDNPGEIAIDTSTDVEIFAKFIAPTLNIKVRFAGEEPFDIVTRQYNESMRSVLPQFNIQFVEIPRYSTSGIIVSATVVRRLLKTHDFEEIKKLVPLTTYEYLVKNCGML